MGFATSRLIIDAVKIPNAIPITPTKTASHAALVAGDRGAKTNNKSDAIGQIDADTAHAIPRPRSESVKMFGVRSARSSRKNTGNNPHWLASSTRKNECVTAMKPETQKEIGRCHSKRGSNGFCTLSSEPIKTGMHTNQATPQIAAANHGK